MIEFTRKTKECCNIQGNDTRTQWKVKCRSKTAHAFFMTGNGGSIVSRPLGLREWLVAVVGGWVQQATRKGERSHPPTTEAKIQWSYEIQLCNHNKVYKSHVSEHVDKGDILKNQQVRMQHCNKGWCFSLQIRFKNKTRSLFATLTRASRPQTLVRALVHVVLCRVAHSHK